MRKYNEALEDLCNESDPRKKAELEDKVRDAIKDHEEFLDKQEDLLFKKQESLIEKTKPKEDKK